MKDHYGDKSRDRASVSLFAQDSPSNKDKSRKDKKKKQDSAIPATGVNTKEVSRRKRKKKKDISEIMYYNYNKKEYYSDKYLEP